MVFFDDSITGTDEGKALFKEGCSYMVNYNHEMAIGKFKACLAADPTCQMANWGIAYSLSSSYNWPPGLGSGHDAIQEAVAGKEGLTDIEKDLIDALATRHSEEAKASANPAALAMGNDPALNVKFAEAMKVVYEKYTGNLDVAAVYAEGLMNLKPWALWEGHAEGRDAIKPADDNTLTAIKVLEDAFEVEGGKAHAALCHLYCHAMELSPTPEKALPAADTLRKLMPDAGHLVHMPSHIDAWVGQWKEGVDCNMDGVAADDRFVEANPGLESCFYKFYRMHNIHFVVWCAMHTGQKKIALEYARKAEAAMPEGDENGGCKFMLAGVIPMGFVFLESYRTMIWHVMIRFGMWDEILAEPIQENKEVFASSIATAYYARGVAKASKGDAAGAREEQKAFLEALENTAFAGRVLHNNAMYAAEGPCVLNVSKSMLEGEILYREEKYDEAFAELKKAVDLELNLKYNEPWGQMQPIRHALGALLLEQGKTDEALEVYKADLEMWQNNMWSTLGVKLCLEAKGVTGEELDAANAAYDKAAQHADEKPAATCFCAKTAGAGGCCSGS